MTPRKYIGRWFDPKGKTSVQTTITAYGIHYNEVYFYQPFPVLSHSRTRSPLLWATSLTVCYIYILSSLFVSFCLGYQQQHIYLLLFGNWFIGQGQTTVVDTGSIGWHMVPLVAFFNPDMHSTTGKCLQ